MELKTLTIHFPETPFTHATTIVWHARTKKVVAHQFASSDGTRAESLGKLPSRAAAQQIFAAIYAAGPVRRHPAADTAEAIRQFHLRNEKNARAFRAGVDVPDAGVQGV